MNLDLRLPLGLLFGIFGVLVTLMGAFGSAADEQRSLGININLIWGVVMLAFGAIMVGLAVRARKSGAQTRKNLR
jgi:hypothetical protein